jgi:hypothetical protein
MTAAYLMFLVTSAGGGILFFAYVLPGRRFPLVALVGHLILATATLLILLVQVSLQHVALFSIMGLTLAFYFVTYVLGLIFFVSFDLKGRRLPLRFLGLHIFLTVVTFVLFTSAVSIRIPYGNPHGVVQTGQNSSLWQLIHRHNSVNNVPKSP